MVFQVSESLCTRCGVCVEECPARVIEMTEKSALPSPTADAEERCINCGHCVAVCPEGAFSLERMPVDQCLPIHEEWFPKPDHLEHFLKARRSIRGFSDEKLDKKVLTALVDFARHAPTGSNSQKVRWLIVHERETVEKVAEMTLDYLRYQSKEPNSSISATAIDRIADKAESGYDYICRGAPHIILAYAPESRTSTDSVIALTYLEIAAFSRGIGPCWGGYVGAAALNWKPLKQLLGVPDGYNVYGAMLLGKPKYKYHKLPLRNEAEVSWVS